MANWEYYRLEWVDVRNVPEGQYSILANLTFGLIQIDKLENGTHSATGAVGHVLGNSNAKPLHFDELGEAFQVLDSTGWTLVTHTFNPFFEGIEVFIFKRKYPVKPGVTPIMGIPLDET